MIKAKQYFIDFFWKIEFDVQTDGWVDPYDAKRRKNRYVTDPNFLDHP